jgi:membrane protein YqaA with SNARE-associated domain
MTETKPMPEPVSGDPPAEAAAAAPVASRNPIRRLYHWVLHWSETPYAAWALFILAFAESSFFPIPPDVLLMAMAFALPLRAFRYAFICTVGSVLGGMFGYWLGQEFFGLVNVIVCWVVGKGAWYGVAHEGVAPVMLSGYAFFQYAADSPFRGDTSIFLRVKELYDNNAFWAVFTAAFTPIPYKVFTVAGGYFQISFGTLVVASILGRGMRFYIVAGLIRIFGRPIRHFIDAYFNLVTVVFTVCLIGSFVLVRYWEQVTAFLRGLFH